MSDAALFIVLFGGLFVIRLIAATVVFLWILPDGDRCPCCDAETLHVESRGALKVMPWFRSSWCYECDWHGMHRVRRAAGNVEPTDMRLNRWRRKHHDLSHVVRPQ